MATCASESARRNVSGQRMATGIGRLRSSCASQRRSREHLPFGRPCCTGRKESRNQNSSQGEWVVELPDDHPGAMTTILNIIHSHFEKVPPVEGKHAVEVLYELCVLSDKYDLGKVLRPWAKTWLQPLRNEYSPGWMLEGGTGFDWTLHKKLWVAWELGDQFLLESTLLEMVLGLETWQFEGSAPPGLLEKAQAVNDEVVAQIYDVFQDAVQQFMPMPQEGSSPCIKIKCVEKERRCHFIMFGSLMTSLVENGLWPLPPKGSRQHSIQSLLTVLSRMNLENRRGKIEDPRPLKVIDSDSSETKNCAFKDTKGRRGRDSPIGVFPYGLYMPDSAVDGANPKAPGWKSLYSYGGGALNTVKYSSGSRRHPHDSCHPVPKAYETIAKVCLRNYVELENFHLKHLRSQATKTGIEPYVSTAQSTPPKGARKRSRMFSSDSEFD